MYHLAVALSLAVSAHIRYIFIYKGYGFYGEQVHCKALTQQLPSVPAVLPHVLAVDSSHTAVVRMRRTYSCETRIHK